MKAWNDAFGFYTNRETAAKVFKRAKAHGLRRSALVGQEGVIKGYTPHLSLVVWSVIVASSIPLFHYFAHPIFWGYLPFGIVFLILLAGGWIYDLTVNRIERKVLKRLKSWIVGEETLVFIQVRAEEVAHTLILLREVESGHPVSFLLRPIGFKDKLREEEFIKEPYNLDQVHELATGLAEKLKGAKVKRGFKQPLLKNLKKSSQILSKIRHDVAEAEHLEQTLSSSAEWLLDNSYVIQGNIEEVQRNLPKKFYQDLPKIEGLPRIYFLAKEMIKSSANKLNRDTIYAFLKSYQSIDPLTIGELWALPLMLRLRLIEVIEYLARDIDRRLCEGEYASFWGNRFLTVSRRDSKRIQEFLSSLKEREAHPSSHFAEELFDHLFDDEAVLPVIRNWIEEKFKMSLSDVVREEQIKTTLEQVAFSSAIVSLITLFQLSWKEVFETICTVDQIFAEDPHSIYPKMDFATRDLYRKELEKLAWGSGKTEWDVARIVLQDAQQGEGPVKSHVGYYLIDRGRAELEKKIGYRPTLPHRFQAWLLHYPSPIYLGAILACIGGIEVIYAFCDLSIYLMILGLIPASEIAIQFLNLLLSRILPPFLLPKMRYETIPEELKTLVVIPTLLSGKPTIKENINRLEVHYLANQDPSLRFAILVDFVDAPTQTTESDLPLLEYAVNGIKWLEEKYGKDTFFLFYRERLYSASEGGWMGWERKRGKLEALNKFLTEGPHPDIILRWGAVEPLQNVKYVITLDADTQLPKDTARQMIATISHPLNQPKLDAEGNVARGYTIIQPKVTANFVHSMLTLFSYIFADEMSIDPYTQAISNVYQDLMQEGTYHGKGIYDVQAFHALLDNRFPDEHLLSHDLIEGLYGRVGFASDISLLDLYPKDYLTWSKRQHRWMRGDWQIIDWLFARVPHPNKKKIKNTLSLISRWKIFDNLRRASLPVFNAAILILAWFFSPLPYFWTIVVLFTIFLPTICHFLINLCTDPKILIFSREQFIKSLLRSLINTSFLLHQAYLSLDAFFRVLYRKYISKKKLLEWTVSAQASKVQKRHFFLKMCLCPAVAVILLVGVWYAHPVGFDSAACVLALWFVSPVVIAILDHVTVKEALLLSAEEKKFLRNAARKTWRFFDHFVTQETNWLPPDNFQSSLVVELAERTSPTNIGLYLLSVLSAYDFRYLTCDELLERLTYTFNTFKKMEMHEGHFLNWYETKHLRPLYPRYVSTVDSGNFLASLLALEQGVYDMLFKPILPDNLFDGVKDAYDLMLEQIPDAAMKQRLKPLEHILNQEPRGLPAIAYAIKEAKKWIDAFIHQEGLGSATYGYWAHQLQQELEGWESLLSRYFSWVEIHPAGRMDISLRDLATGRVHFDVSDPHFIERLSNAQWFAGEKMGQARQIMDAIQEISKNMNMSFLYNPDRKLFSIGYNIENNRLDNSFYDLLASEARIASLVAIAKDDVPLDHWWALARSYRFSEGRQVLMSWGGTMFEYLMPLLFNFHYPESLLGNACSAAVKVQMRYGKKRGIPWGISEAAYSEIDIRRIYQYRSFGVPGLGFKQGLEEDLVVSPYSTALALMVSPKKAVKNLQDLNGEHFNMLSTYGFFESIDFARQQGPLGERGVIVYAYFAHHQGMSFLAFNNVLHSNLVAKRFHMNPRISGIDPLLSEKVPIYPSVAKGIRRERPVTRLTPFSTVPIMGMVDTPHSTTPKVNLLSNGDYSVMLTNSGGGYSRWRDFDVTRWYADTTRDSWGTYCYIQDLTTGNVWSKAYHPMKSQGRNYTVTFKTDKVEIRRRDHDIETLTEVAVSPEDDAEVRVLTIANLSKETRVLQFTSYSELALAPHAADRAHPVFNKMFIQTEGLDDLSALLAFRRARSPDDPPIFAAHLVASNHPLLEGIEYETDRSRFIGRGRTVENPLALERELTKTSGYVLDPIFSMRVRLEIKPGERAQLSFVTVTTDQREHTINLVKKYRDFYASQRALEMAWTHAQLELRHLRIHQEEAQLFQKLAGRILYPHAQLRPPTDQLRKNKLGQSSLWTYGISGDLPIVIAAVSDPHDLDLVRQVITAHAFWRMRGLKVDLVILNEEEGGYEHPLYQQLFRLIQSHAHLTQMGKSGGCYLLNTDQIPKDDLTLLLSISRANLIAARGYLRQQVVSPVEATRYAPRLLPNHAVKDVPSPALPFWELALYNGYGGFTLDGKEYVIYLDGNKTTPLPWINVLSNAEFGTLVTESGLGTTWYGNSQTNRLTPWSNDPLLNPICDTIYIRDEDLGTFWTLTPSPIREREAYRIRFGQGYSHFEHISHGIEQELTIFVPVDDAGGLPLRIQKVRLRNLSSVERKISLFGYLEWVLGTDREQTESHVITEWDPESQAILAFNHYNGEYKDFIAFAASSPVPKSFTANRTEFLGRNHPHSNPFSLRRKFLTGTTGAALDPCAALQVEIELKPGETKEAYFVLGYAVSDAAARQTIAEIRKEGKVEQLLHGTSGYWDKVLSTLQVETPDQGLNFTLNRWMLYQVLSCRYWGRTAFYQSSGAYGFRDQLQDVMALLYAAPQMARQHILRAASRQFEEGDVQHWWHPPQGGGVRTRIADDLLWLPFVIAQYVRVTGDLAILEERVPFIKGELLKADQREAYFVPEVSGEEASLLEHCRRAVYKGITAGSHGLPLMGTGDWNDGMNLVGVEGKGESIWLGWFLTRVLSDFAEVLELAGQQGAADGYRAQAHRLSEQIEKSGWDGSWYRRAYFDDGTPLGSAENSEGVIDSIAQSWAVLSGAAQEERARKALESAVDYLVKRDEKLILLLTPAFDVMVPDPGYIKGYPPGVRENGGQYTHGSLWLPMAFLRLGDGDRGCELLRMMHPLSHSETQAAADIYKCEPFAIVGDVYSMATQVGRGGWSWYTGAAGWMYRIYIEEMLGFKVRGNAFTIHPVLPSHWEQIKLRYKNYSLVVQNPKGKPLKLSVDNKEIEGEWVTMIDDGKVHVVVARERSIREDVEDFSH